MWLGLPLGLLAACCCPACPYAWAVLLAALLGLLGALVPACWLCEEVRDMAQALEAGGKKRHNMG